MNISKIKNNFGRTAIIVLSFLPILFWLAMKPIGLRFVSPMAVLTSLGQISGLAGMAMFSLVLVLSGRFEFLEDYFGGLNRIYINHHLFGGIAFVLMLFHPLVLAGKYLFVSARSAMEFLSPSVDWAKNFGIFGLLFLIIFLFITFFMRLRYEKWKFTHKFLGLAFFLAGLHSFMVASDISRSVPLRIYMFVLATAGLLSYFYRVIFFSILVKKYDYMVKDVKIFGEKVMEIEMSPVGEPLFFMPGQFVFVSFQDKTIGSEVHPFSIASSSAVDKNLKIMVKVLGDFTARLKNLKIGTVVKIEGPFGRFYSQTDEDQIWIAGGIGIVPFLSMARSLADGEMKGVGNISLFYCTVDEKEVVYLDEFLKISQEHNNFKSISFCSNKQGFITAEYIKNTVGDLMGKEIFVCGPPSMMKNLRNQFLKMGVGQNNIHSEEFQL